MSAICINWRLNVCYTLISNLQFKKIEVTNLFKSKVHKKLSPKGKCTIIQSRLPEILTKHAKTLKLKFNPTPVLCLN